MDFGELVVGAEATKTATASTLARTPVRIALSAPDGPFRVEPLTGSAQAGSPLQITVRFAPDSPGSYEATSKDDHLTILMHGSARVP
jgi:hypothetical protein